MSPEASLPKRLPPAGRVAVIATASALQAGQIDAGLTALARLGHRALEGPTLELRERSFAGSIDQRARDLGWALSDPEVDAVWVARGGYGTAQLLASLEGIELDERPVIGYSDLTALHVWLARRGRASIHGPVLKELPARHEALVPLLAGERPPALAGAQLCGSIRPLEGPLLGGNLTVLSSLCGTPFSLDARGAIVLLEDTGEAPYRLERALTQLIDSGALDGACAFGLGDFTRCGEPGAALAALRARLEPLGRPVIAGLPFGHGARNLAWIHGAAYRLEAATLSRETGLR